MRKIVLLLAIIVGSITSVKASHLYGGEISWRCLANGQYIFSMSVYRDCSGVNFTFQNETLTIIGSPLPVGSTGGSISSIVLIPDQNTFQNSNNGDTAPDCTDLYGDKFSCADAQNGMIQQFTYNSAPVTLGGVPPGSGWKFFWESPCCRPGDVENVNTNGVMLLQAIMYPFKGQSTDPCFDSSPSFRALPTTLICRGNEFTYNHTAIDNDLDSLIYRFGRPFNPPINNPQALTYSAGYSPTSPTPDQNFNINNIPSTLDPLSGVTDLAVFSGAGIRKYLVVVQVDSYRESQRISSVFREIPISVFDCPALPNGLVNRIPRVNINGKPTSSTITDIVAGQTVSIPVQVIDDDLTGVAPFLQTLTMVPDGLLFTQSRGENSPCIISNPNVEPCAFLRNLDPFIDQTLQPNASVLKDRGVIGTEFVWQTDCKHIKTRTGFPGTNQGIYNFVMRVYDDHCPIPALNYPTITVRVSDPVPLEEPIMKGVSVLLDGTVKYSWAPPIDSASQFSPPVRETDHYESEKATPLAGAPATFWSSLDPNIRNYKQDKATGDIFIYNLNVLTDPNSGFNLLQPAGSQFGQISDNYVRMRTLSGCTDTNTSILSNVAQVMRLNHTGVGVFPDPLNSVARLTWNLPTRPNSKTHDYYRYESPTHFYIHTNDSISNGGVGDINNWYIVGETSDTTFDTGSTTCGDFVGFRIEARDTVVTWKEGSSIRTDSLDTLYFSTFSMIDTMFMTALSFIPDPTFDTVEVRADGTVFLRINLLGKLTTGTYRIFQNDTLGTPLATVNALQDSVVVLSGANLNIQNIIIQAIDACKPNELRPISAIYNTILPTGLLTDPCAGEYTLNWLKPGGFPNDVAGYRVYGDFDDGNGLVLVSTIADGNTTSAVISGISRGNNYRFQVIAFDARGAVNISALDFYTSPPDLATNDLVPPPTPRCTFVNDDGSVTLSWIQANDSVNNFDHYNIQYRTAASTASGGPWLDIAGDADDLLLLTDETYTVTGINAQIEQYDFQITSMAGCDGDQPSTYSPISSIFVEITPTDNPTRVATLNWNPAGPAYGATNFLSVNGPGSPLSYNDHFYFKSDTDTNGLEIDSTIVNIDCSVSLGYHVSHIDSVFDPIGFRCNVRSNIAPVDFVDTVPPAPENLQMITFNRVTKQLVAWWAGSTPGLDSIILHSIDGFNSGIQNLTTVSDGYVAHSLLKVEISRDSLDAADTVGVVGTSGKDICNNPTRGDIVYHESMDVDVEWSVCDSINTVVWTPYVGLNPDFGVEYELFFRKDGETMWTAVPNSITIDTTAEHLIEDGGRTYFYYVRATSLDPATPAFITPESNVDSIFSAYEDTPLYFYLTYATVLPTNDVEVQYYRDTVTPVKRYTVFRGENANELFPIRSFETVNLIGQDRFTFVDQTADVNSKEYYYQVISENDCDIITSRSNFGRTIHLDIQSDDEALTNTLTWNRYLDWDSTVSHYNIYRTSEEIYSTEVYKTVAPNSAYDYNIFVDDISEEVLSKGKFYYRVEAVQGPFDSTAAINGFTSDLTSEVSNSNIASALQNPLMYVPNAFSPDGVNRTFAPKGQFFDFTQFEMAIYNRWGEQIYITNDINKGWDGTVDGEDASIGSYVYMIRYRNGDGEEKRRKGSLTLIR